MAELIRDAPASVLACYAHPDDPEVSCGGTLARWTAAGAEVHTVVCTSGDKGSSDPATDPAELVARRAEEVAAAASLVGLAGHHLLGHPDGELENGPSLRRELVALIRQVRPQVVVCPDPQAVLFGQDYYNHLDHRVVGWATLDAAAPAAALPLYFPETGPPHQVEVVYLSGTLEPDVWVDVSDTLDVKIEALFRHTSQLTETGEFFRAFLRERAEEAGRAAGVRYAEGFRRLTLLA